MPAAPASLIPKPLLGRSTPRPSPPSVHLSEVLAALSHALDLTEGQPVGHSIRSCLIAMRVARELGLSTADRSALYYAMLLKGAGCSSNAARIATLFGADDRLVKPRMKIVDWHRAIGLAVETFRSAALDGSWANRVRHFVGIVRTKNMTGDLIDAKSPYTYRYSTRVAEIARGVAGEDAFMLDL